MGEINDAFEAIKERKHAAGAQDALLDATGNMADWVVRSSFLGCDVDVKEVKEVALRVVTPYELAHALGISAGLIGAGGFIEGLNVGFLVAEKRARGEGS